MIDNFLNINHIFFNQKEELQSDYFYHLQIIQRKKDIEGLGCNNILLKAIIIDDDHPLDKFKDDIIDMCESFYQINLRLNNPIIKLEEFMKLKIKDENYKYVKK